MSAPVLCKKILGWFVVLAALCACSGVAAPEEPKPKPAKLEVSGYGLFGNRQLRRIIRTLELGGTKPTAFSPWFIEDSALILTAKLKQDGYLEPTVFVRVRTEDGRVLQVRADQLIDNPLPRPLSVVHAEFIIRKGTLFYFSSLEFDGLETLAPRQARSYFVETGTAIPTKKTRVFTPDVLQRGLGSLREVLERQGFRQASAEIEEDKRNPKTGAVAIRIQVRQGPRYLVRSVKQQLFVENQPLPAWETNVYPARPFSRLWLQDFQQSIRTNQFALGYPDTRVETKIISQEPASGTNIIDVDLATTVRSGPRVRVGSVDFIGEKHTSEPFLSRRVRVARGDWLDPAKVEQGRHQLAQLGIFKEINLSYSPVDEHTRNVLFEVEEGKRFNLSLLFGYGSYELLRGGFEAELFNIWGLAHYANLKAVQSFKASSGDFTYTIPQFLARDMDLFFDASGLRREEVSFTREEYGGGFGAHRFFRRIATDLTVRYQYEILNAADLDSDFAIEGLTNAAVSAIITDLKHDRRDNPLYPRRGYKVFTTLELASDYLGGEVSYQRMDTSASWHKPLGYGLYLGAGLGHGLVAAIGDRSEDLPFNRRFFSGGENSIRGYQEGEASPRNEQGKFVGSETYTLGTVELELSLTPKWSLVFFSDSLGFARRLENYPFDTGLFSAGGGIRWKTIVGPVRLEYGHNLNPRAGDPSGTLHFSLGFPF